MTPIEPRLQRLLDGPDTRRLRQRLANKLRRGETLTGNVTLDRPNAAEAAAVARLLGRPAGNIPNQLKIDLKRIENTLVEAGLCSSLVDALEQLEGPIHNERAPRDQASAVWESVLQKAIETGQHIPGNITWIKDLQQSGLLRRLARSDPAQAKNLLTSSQQVLTQLPHPGITRAVLAAQCTGDSHGLDPNQPIATLVIRAISLGILPRTTSNAKQAVKVGTAGERHALWESVGVIENDLTRSVLCLNLKATGEGLIDQTLRLHANHGQPCALTLRQLIQHAPALANGIVYTCENPTVLAVSAHRLGRDCPPMVCVGGRPGSATHQLLHLLKEAGCTLWYHGDFDWAGLAIANQIIQTYDAEPWRMSQHDYADAIPLATIPLSEHPISACWDPELSNRMQREGLAIHEEMLIENLLDDLCL